MEVDYEPACDEKIPIAKDLAKRNPDSFHEAIEMLLTLENKHETKLKLIDTLRVVTEGKIYVEIERARLTKILADIKEADGDIAGAAAVMEELQVETYGSMDKREKVRITFAKAEPMDEDKREVMKRKEEGKGGRSQAVEAPVPVELTPEQEKELKEKLYNHPKNKEKSPSKRRTCEMENLAASGEPAPASSTDEKNTNKAKYETEKLKKEALANISGKD
ncbi:26S proteasome non-ATPase regulatory subunit 12 [Eumeta japonica]|uniref:26S proteasome non-ATPase regulatory subunit 12 n=1 Tax=Eumeta variegata TaxID=151549 RepID=A0A4C1SZ23_EUMVA|nr:26S proteasome non-ATPase regulatory subunit 12 [Eumeta japonica]